MLRSTWKILCVLVSAAVLSYCNNYEFPATPYPRVKTLPVTNISSAGVTFQGDVTWFTEQAIISHGFVWSEASAPTIDGENRIQLKPSAQPGLFTANLNSNLVAESIYYVKAYVTTANYIVYGEAVPFTAKGSNAPIIESFSPSEGTLGDTIVIKGKYFAHERDGNSVSFASVSSNVISSTDSTILSVVPFGIPPTSSITVTVSGMTATAPGEFSFVQPVITVFSPSTGTFGDVVTIEGSDFSSVQSYNVIRFNEIPVEVLTSTRRQIKVKVPTSISVRENNVNVIVGSHSVVSDTKFSILPPSISSVSASGSIGSTLEIIGANFNPLSSGNVVFFEERIATITSASKNFITVQVPGGIYKNRSFNIGVTVAEQTAMAPGNFTLQDAWIQKADLPVGNLPASGPRRYGAVAFAINGKGYAGLGGEAVDNSFYKFDPLENTWTKVSSYPGGRTVYAVSFVIGGVPYVGLGVDDGANGDPHKDLWKYNPETDSWQQMADFPEEYLYGWSYGFAANGKGYVVTSSSMNNFWEFDPVENLWTQKPELVFKTRYYQDAGFVVNDRLFIVRADEFSSNRPPPDFWEFDFALNHWVERQGPDAPDYSWYHSPGGTGFTIGSHGYVAVNISTRAMHRYDVNTGVWKKLKLEIGSGGSPIAFVINDKVYYGTGNPVGGAMWEYDPAYEQE